MLQRFGYIEKGKGQWQNEVTVQNTEGQVSDITERYIEELEEQNTEHIREQKDITWKTNVWWHHNVNKE